MIHWFKQKAFYAYFAGILSFILLVGSCGISEYGQIVEGSMIVLHKQKFCFRGGCDYKMYVFNGKSSEWYYVSDRLFDKYERGDTLNDVTVMYHGTPCDSFRVTKDEE